MKLWRVLGVAGLAGGAATGAIPPRHPRTRANLPPQVVRARLQERLKEGD